MPTDTVTSSRVRAVPEQPHTPLPPTVELNRDGAQGAHGPTGTIRTAAITADLDARLPKQLVYLRICKRKDGGSGFDVEIDAPEAYADFTGLHSVSYETYPRLNFVEDLRPGLDMDRQQFWRDIKQASSKFRKIGGWLSQLYSHASGGEPIHLIIQDSVGIEFPWETLTFADISQGAPIARRLGAAFTVTRWMPYILTASYEDIMSPDDLDDLCEGKVLAYISQDIDDQDERDTLDSYDGTVNRDIQSFCTDLYDALDDCGLVYLGCHAQFAEDPNNADPVLLIGALDDENSADQPVRTGIRHRTPARPQADHGSKPLVFVNACHSGISTREHTRTGVSESLPRLFLQNAAQGVIVTLGFVDATSFAPQMAKRVLKAQEDNAVSTAEALRRIRESEHQALHARMAGGRATQPTQS